MLMGERYFDTPRHEDEMVRQQHESLNGGVDCGSAKHETIHVIA